jgi:hypothetical protein
MMFLKSCGRRKPQQIKGGDDRELSGQAATFTETVIFSAPKPFNGPTEEEFTLTGTKQIGGEWFVIQARHDLDKKVERVVGGPYPTEQAAELACRPNEHERDMADMIAYALAKKWDAENAKGAA